MQQITKIRDPHYFLTTPMYPFIRIWKWLCIHRWTHDLMAYVFCHNHLNKSFFTFAVIFHTNLVSAYMYKPCSKMFPKITISKDLKNSFMLTNLQFSVIHQVILLLNYLREFDGIFFTREQMLHFNFVSNIFPLLSKTKKIKEEIYSDIC
jgi:hypothetical protein